MQIVVLKSRNSSESFWLTAYHETAEFAIITAIIIFNLLFRTVEFENSYRPVFSGFLALHNCHNKRTVIIGVNTSDFKTCK